jgi:hypothetical protein
MVRGEMELVAAESQIKMALISVDSAIACRFTRALSRFVL